jgi:hypothetical protein
MAQTTVVAYRLPCAVVVVAGTLRRVLDKDVQAHKGFEEVTPTLVSKAITVRHQADDSAPHVVAVQGGWLFQYKASFSLKEDGRLTKASAEATGAGAELVSAGATLAGAAIGVLTMFAADVDLEDRRRRAYELAHQDVVAEVKRLKGRRADVSACIRSLEDGLIADPSTAPHIGPRLEALREVATATESRLATLEAHYATWLATRRTTVDDTFEIEVALKDLPQSLEMAHERYGDPGSVSTPLSAPLDLAGLWQRFGVGVIAQWTRRGDDVAAWPPPGKVMSEKCLVVRKAEPLDLLVVEHHHEQPVITGRSRHLVADASSPHDELELKRSLFGRRSLTATLSDNGYLAGIDAEGAAILGEAAKALSGATGSVVGGLDSVNKLQSGLATARQAGLTAELARVKAQVELRQQELLAAGLDATEDQATELTRLTQLKGILEAQAAIKKLDPTFVSGAQGAAPGED